MSSHLATMAGQPAAGIMTARCADLTGTAGAVVVTYAAGLAARRAVRLALTAGRPTGNQRGPALTRVAAGCRHAHL